MRKIKIISIISLILMSVLIMIGCSILSKDEKIVLTYYSHLDKDGEKEKIIKLFEKKNPHIDIKLIELPSETNMKLATLIDVLQRENGDIDIFDGDVVWPAIFVSKGWILSLDDYVTQDEMSQFLPGAVFSNQIEGKYYGIPYRTDSGMLYYRKDLLDKYDQEVPTSWDQLVKTASHIMNEEAKIGKVIKGYGGSWQKSEALMTNLTEIIWSYGGKILDESGSVVLNSPEVVQAINQLVAMKNDLMITHDDINVFNSGKLREKFMNEELIFARDWPRGWLHYNDSQSNVSGKVGVAQLPVGRVGNNNYSTLGGWQVMVSSSSKHANEAVMFAKFRASEEIQILMAKELNHIPSRIGLYRNEEVLKAMPFLEAMYPAIKNAYPRPKTPYYSELSRILQSEISDAIEGGKTVEQAVKNAHQRIEELLERE